MTMKKQARQATPQGAEVKLPSGYKSELFDFQRAVERMRALEPFSAYERRFIQDRIKNHVGDLSTLDIFFWITENLDMGGGGDATSHGLDILEAATHLARENSKKFLRARGKHSTVAYFEKKGY